MTSTFTVLKLCHAILETIDDIFNGECRNNWTMIICLNGVLLSWISTTQGNMNRPISTN